MKPRSLWPREHGAYAELGLPLLVALVAGSRTWRAFAMTAGALAVFLASEPFLILVGQQPPSRTAATVAGVPMVAAALATVDVLRWWTVAAATPLVVVAAAVALRPPSPRSLRRVGWTLVGATVATGATIVIGMS